MATLVDLATEYSVTHDVAQDARVNANHTMEDF